MFLRAFQVLKGPPPQYDKVWNLVRLCWAEVNIKGEAGGDGGMGLK